MKEKTILVYFQLRDKKINQEDINEMESLIESSGGEVCAIAEVKKNFIDSKYYIGKGKCLELKESAEMLDVSTLIFNVELSGSNIKNLEDITGLKIIDKTNLILDIFASRAKTKQSVLQVELAEYKYRLPRLIGFGANLSRTGGGIGTRGPGETKLEVDRRTIQRKIDNIKRELKSIDKSQENMRKHRLKSDIKMVSMVGYTNAGKSTLSNKLVNFYKDKYNEEFATEDLLFKTLDTTLRKCHLPNKKDCLIIDTVGFIKDIPTDLIEAFKSTLIDLKYSDLIIFVLDLSSSDLDNQITTTMDILSDLKVLDKPMITVFNKKDKSINPILSHNLENKIKISAFDDNDIEELLFKIQEQLYGQYKKVEMEFDYSHQDLLNKFLQKFKCEDVIYSNDKVTINVSLPESEIDKYEEYIIWKITRVYTKVLIFLL